MSDDVRYAFAALGLTPDASLTTVRRRYRALVRVWHPDRFASDPQAVADATIKMRVINGAYQRILETHEAEQRAAAVRPAMPTSRGERDSEVRLESLRPESALHLVGRTTPASVRMDLVGHFRVSAAMVQRVHVVEDPWLRDDAR